MKKVFLLIGLIFLCSSCSFYQIDSENTSYDYYPSRKNKSEVVYVEQTSKPYDVIGRVQVNAERNKKRNMKDIIEKLKLEAAMMGGDAITNISSNSGSGKWAKIKPKKLFG